MVNFVGERMVNYIRNWTQTWTRMSNVVYRDTSPYVKKFRIGTTVSVNTSHSLRISQISVLRHGFVFKNLHTEKVLQVKSFGCTSFRVDQR